MRHHGDMVSSGDRSEDEDDCVFCRIVSGRASADIVFEDDSTLAFMDIDPGADGHVLVIPKEHSVDLLSIPASDLAATTLAAQRIARALRHDMGADGVNLLNCSGAAAWQTVFHFHLHVIPRYRDKDRDRLQLPFEPGTPSDAGARADYARRLSGLL